jgi:cobalt-zinc-cadmium efflux system protein
VLAGLAFWWGKRNATRKFTYGRKKATVLVSLVNAVTLLALVGIIIVESVKKLIQPPSAPMDGLAIALVAGCGVLINGFTAYLFAKEKDKDLNIKGAYLHMAADALVSVGVVVSGLIIYFTGWYYVDPIMGLVIAGVIIYSTWELFTGSIRLSLDGMPLGVNYEQIVKTLSKHPEVKDVHHVHIWAISTTENALTAHIVLYKFPTDQEYESIKTDLKDSLSAVGINHATLEFETTAIRCTDEDLKL